VSDRISNHPSKSIEINNSTFARQSKTQKLPGFRSGFEAPIRDAPVDPEIEIQQSLLGTNTWVSAKMGHFRFFFFAEKNLDVSSFSPIFRQTHISMSQRNVLKEVQRRFCQAHCGHEPVFRESFSGEFWLMHWGGGVEKRVVVSFPISIPILDVVYDLCMTV